jgi:transcriptional regulator with XRE-family HTH domain
MNTKITSAQAGRKFRELRNKLNWSQGIVAQKLGLSIPAYSKIETGITDLNISRFIQICDLFEIDPVDVLVPDSSSKLVSLLTETKEKLSAARDEINELQRKLIKLYELVNGETENP